MQDNSDAGLTEDFDEARRHLLTCLQEAGHIDRLPDRREVQADAWALLNMAKSSLALSHKSPNHHELSFFFYFSKDLAPFLHVCLNMAIEGGSRG